MEITNVGRFDTKVLLLRPNTARSQSGEVVKTFVEDGYVYADVSHDTGESIQGEAMLSSDDCTITCHPWHGVKTSWRIVIDDATYEIMSVTEIDRRYMKIRARLLLE